MKRQPFWKYSLVVTLLLTMCAAFALEVKKQTQESAADSDTVSEGAGELLETEEVMPLEAEVPVAAPADVRWSAPNYSDQERALGWTEQAFAVPKGMEDRVNFWREIYTKYNSDQGVLHDSKYVHLMYDNVDFSDISIRQDLTSKQKEKMRRKRVDDAKKQVVERLKKLEGLKSAEGLEGEDLRFYEMFAKVDEEKKFSEAGRKGRLRFQLGQRDQFKRGIYQSGRYLRQMEEIFRQEGLPMELTRLPFVESSFNLKARSKVGASGIWQFMRSTARRYMRLDASADERNDPLRATRAAARKLRENFEMLKSWPLAVTAYNHGPSGVKRLTDKMGTTDIVELIDVRKGRFGFASASFFASFLAAIEVERNANKYFGELEVMPELRGAEIQIGKSLYARDFLKWFNGDVELAKAMNPHFTERVWNNKVPLSARHHLRVPIALEEQVKSELR